MVDRRRFLSLLAAASGAAMLGGCRPRAPLVRIATNVWPGYEPLYVARARGRLPANLRLIELLSASQVLAALRTGLVEAAGVTLDEALRLRDLGVPVRVIAVFDVSAGADALVGRNLAGLSDLRGHRIGVENSALGAYFFSRILELAGLVRTDVEVVYLDISHQEAAFRAGDVDAVVTFDPVRSRLLAVGGTIVVDSRALPDEIVDVLVTRDEVLAGPERRRTLADALVAVDRVVRDLPGDDAALAIMGRRLGLDAPQVAQALTGLRLTTLADTRRFVLGPTPALARPIAVLTERMYAAGLLSSAIVDGALIDDRVVREADR